ncbi:MAG TPA: hypothetical protein DEG88_10690 [Propionibacteriaceae bacterium]|nr:hypothetical protein [Propionibacteriaceae bacterium]HBY23711.1 hypothetical protein [Propionibacteriaceae bacterium]
MVWSSLWPSRPGDQVGLELSTERREVWGARAKCLKNQLLKSWTEEGRDRPTTNLRRSTKTSQASCAHGRGALVVDRLSSVVMA